MNSIIFYGAKWCAPCHQLRQQLDKKSINYEFKDVDEKANEEAMLEVSDGRYLIPTVVIGESVLQNPTMAMVESKLQ